MRLPSFFPHYAGRPALMPTVAALSLLCGACGTKDGLTPPVTPVPTSISPSAGDGQTATVGTPVAVAPSVTVRDQDGRGIGGVTVTFAVTAGGGNLTGATTTTNPSGLATVGGWTLGTVAGANTLSATVQGLAAVSLSATGVAGTPTQMTAATVSSQSGPPNQAVGTPPAVRLRDRYGNDVAGGQVMFTPSAGGSVTGSPATTDASGVATVGSWTIVDGGNVLTASAAGVPDVTFFAIGTTSPYSIALDFRTSMTPSQTAAFVGAAEKWMSVIRGDLADVTIPAGGIPANVCGNNPAFSGTIDDLYIWAMVEPIDGPGGILAQAGPCFVRNPGGLTFLGLMRFDAADMANLEAAGSLGDVILHEMGHVIGVGTLWTRFGLLQNPSCGGTGPTCNPDDSGADTYFSGTQAITQFDAVGGTGWIPPTSASSKVPVENTAGGRGTRDGHWRESTLGNELMTGFIGSGGNPLSTVTAASLADMGYVVDLGNADAYVLANPTGLRAETTAPSIDLGDDILSLPLFTVSPTGTLRRVR